ncbi:arginine--tRNA ligase [Candidatus Beckwithbacteria bacterium CG10_big_fil_rev_8_21_14_0_10_34_10]|uniref:Arginine--tRNA ligase n=1 Tax=Candidatus Beckwithbacteria bacterium CG10_big_fil_rev_8_21_14_0_10_34_10 TaxID=1974495 RepID=A0A2H0W8R9_9BACT|nr:MAG: arginine--tRNA ligase [Candidatus Beckwithbacteria bacterium CG10_big_fil_rev_8_21_14_0_10_34_10]
MEKQIEKLVIKLVKKLYNFDLEPNQFLAEPPDNEVFGDFSSNIALILGKKLKRKPMDLGQEIVKELEKDKSLNSVFVKIEVLPPGFINFHFKKEYLLKLFKLALEKGAEYGSNNYFKGKKIMVEYAHPNTHKLFHLGHLRNITNGEAVVRILKSLGAKVIRANYQGDVGMHIAKCLWAVKKDKISFKTLKNLDQKIEYLGKAYVKGNKAYEKNKKAKAEILEVNRKIYEKKDQEIIDLWQETRQWSLDYFERIYKRLDSCFDRFYFESEVALKGKEIVLKALKKDIFKKSKGAIIFPGSKYGLHDRVFITSQGNPTYEAKDMELGRLQFEEYNPDFIIHNVGPEQAEYFKVIFKALEMVSPFTKDREKHLLYGWVRLKKGKMSSRLGNVVTGEWLLDEAKKRLKKEFPETKKEILEMIGTGSVKYSFLKVGSATDLAFDIDESISLQGNSGPYLQYTYARCLSVLNKAGIDIKTKSDSLGFREKDLVLNQEELGLLRTFLNFSQVVLRAGQEYSPNLIANFLYDFSKNYNAFYNKHRILKEKDKDKRIFRLALTKITGVIIKKGLYLLGIKAPQKM